MHNPTYKLAALLCGTILLSFTPQTKAVIVAGGDGTQNSTATGAGGGWNYVSALTNIYGSASAIYLGSYGGNYWAIRSAHSGSPAASLTFNSISVNAVAGTNIRVLNDPNDSNSGTDLVLFQVDANPGLPNLNLLAGQLPTSTALRLIGNGRNREATLTKWDASWVETNNQNAPYQGYKWAAGNTVRWGDNSINAFGSAVLVPGQGVVDYFYSDFDAVSGEAQAATGDSGGGAFYYSALEDKWYLAGVMLTVESYSNQPASTSIYGQTTYYADISQYSTFILQTIPEPSILGLMGSALAACIFLFCRSRRAN